LSHEKLLLQPLWLPSKVAKYGYQVN